MLIRIYNDKPNIKDIARVAGILKDGGLMVYPTDSVYAIGCDALNVRAVERICKMKNINPQKSDLSIICRDLAEVSKYARMSNSVFKLMKKNLPGPFTFILPTSNELPKIYKNRKEVGIRVPDNNIVRTIVQELGNPLLTMSVHDDDDEILEYSTDPELIAEKYDGRVDLVIDGGYGGLEPSTVVDCTTDEFEIIRQGKGQLRRPQGDHRFGRFGRGAEKGGREPHPRAHPQDHRSGRHARVHLLPAQPRPRRRHGR